MLVRIAFAFVGVAIAAGAETLDRIAVTVGKQVISESDVIRDLRVSAFLDRKPVDLTPDVKRKAAERLVDQVLILREAAESRIPIPTEDEVPRMLEDVRAMFSSPAEYQKALTEYGVSEPEVRAQLEAGLRTLRFTSQRFRGEIQISEDELREFYQLLAAGWRRSGTERVPTFEESREQVETLATRQRETQALDQWLSSARTQAGVRYRDRVFQ